MQFWQTIFLPFFANFFFWRVRSIESGIPIGGVRKIWMIFVVGSVGFIRIFIRNAMSALVGKFCDRTGKSLEIGYRRRQTDSGVS